MVVRGRVVKTHAGGIMCATIGAIVGAIVGSRIGIASAGWGIPATLPLVALGAYFGYRFGNAGHKRIGRFFLRAKSQVD